MSYMALTPSPSPNFGRGEQDSHATYLSSPSPSIGREVDRGVRAMPHRKI
jgi:hypothetical protein